VTGQRSFDPSELDAAGLSAGDLSDAMVAAREIERARVDAPSASTDFIDRVMAAVEAEPDPRPAAAVARAARTGRVGGIVVALADAWRSLTGPGRPMVVRARAAGVLLAAALGLGLVGGVVAVGASRLLAPDQPPSPTPSVVAPTPTPSPSPTPTSTPSPSSEPSPTPSASPTESVEPTAEPTDTAGPTGTAEPTDTAEPTASDDDGDGSGSGGNGDSSGPGSSGNGDSSGPGSGDD
jgi:uncharacterized membrane protein YgcG